MYKSSKLFFKLDKSVDIGRRIVTSRLTYARSVSSHSKNLINMIGEDIVYSEDINKYTTDWTQLYSGGSAVVKPYTVSNVSKLLEYCNNERIPVVPQGKRWSNFIFNEKYCMLVIN